MHFAKVLSLIATALLVSAAPHKKRTAASDILVFQFADVLEQLESSFYSQALSEFQASDFTSAGFSSSGLAIEQITVIQTDEATHSSILQAAIQSFGANPITSCQFDFSSALTDVTTMAATARIVESVGVSAYLGGAALISDPVLLTSAASILTVEARHQTILNILSGVGTAIPDPFDLALTPSEVLALVGPFFNGPCDVGIPANPVLSVTNTGPIAPGTQLSFSSPAINSSTDTSGFFCQMLLGGQPTSLPFPFNSCVVPSAINGPVAIFITSDGQPLINNVVDRATTQLVAGPLLTFIDTDSQLLGEAVGITSGSSSSGNNTCSSSSSSGNSTYGGGNSTYSGGNSSNSSGNSTYSGSNSTSSTYSNGSSTGSSSSSTYSSNATATTTYSSVSTGNSTSSTYSSNATATATYNSVGAATNSSTSAAAAIATATTSAAAAIATDSSTSAAAATATSSLSSVTTSTETISPAQASAIIANASSSAASSASSSPVN